jgi:acyl-homoserine-lactone acylase
VHTVEESPLSVNPANGWIQNTNNWPWSVAGGNSPKRASYPKYMETYLENPRGLHAIRVLDGKTDFTLESLRDAAYDSYLTGFTALIPALIQGYDALPASDPNKAALKEQIAALRGWDLRWSSSSVATTLAVFWGEELWKRARTTDDDEDLTVYDLLLTRTTPQQKLEDLATASALLTTNFGSWKTPWGEVNRFQRLTADIVQPFSDAGPSLAVPFASARWGSLASFGARAYPGTKKWYGTSGNSFVAVVEFGEQVRAKAVTAGGLNNVPGSKHFGDQTKRYAQGDLREVYFYPAQLKGHTERSYHPGN